jgi:hypothetical protein
MSQLILGFLDKLGVGGLCNCVPVFPYILMSCSMHIDIVHETVVCKIGIF